MSAAESFDAEIALEPVLSKFKKFHESLWGQSLQQKRKISVQASEPTGVPQPAPPPPSDADPVVRIIASVEPGVSTSQVYSVYRGLEALSRMLDASSGISDILIGREEYDRLLERILHGDLQVSRKIVVTGQPGIGKTSFLLFVFLQRMQERLATAIQFMPGQYFIFNERGVILRTDGMTKGDDPELANCWALADSNADAVVPCHDFRKSTPRRLIQTTSPRPDRWKDWAKDSRATIVIMELPNALDVAAIAHAQELDYVKALELMDRWGPSIRTITNLMDREGTSELEHRAKVEAAANLLTKGDLLDSLLTDRSMAGVGVLDGKNSSILFLRPRRLLRTADDPGCGDDDKLICSAGAGRIVEHRGLHTLTIPTVELRTIFEDKRHKLTDQEAFQLFEVLSTHPLTRGATGWYHEVIVHKWMRFGEDALEIYDAAGAKSDMLPARRILTCPVSALAVTIKLGDSVYWIPMASNFPGIDGVLVADQNLYAVQSTISSTHSSPSEGLKKVWQNLNANVRTRFVWHVVFVTRELPHDEHVRHWHGRLRVGGVKDVKVWGCTFNAPRGGGSAIDGTEGGDVTMEGAS